MYRGNCRTGGETPAGPDRALLILLLCCLLAAAAFFAIWLIAQTRGGSSSGAGASELLKETPVIRKADAPVEEPKPRFAPGDVVGRIVIPGIGLDSPVYEMAGVEDGANLERGPAHLAGTAPPGEKGNCVISGHRVTYTRPFYCLDRLAVGDEVVLLDNAGTSYSYRVSRVLVVKPDAVEVLEPTPEASLTLITCNPAFSARTRLIVKAVMGESGGRR